MTKFLGIHFDANLSWNSHIEHVCGKLSNCFYVLLQLKDTLNEDLLLNVYYALAYSVLSYNVIAWGNAVNSERVLIQQKRLLRLIYKMQPRDSCRPIFKTKRILTFPCIFIYKSVMYLKSRLKSETNGDAHTYNTRHADHLRTHQHRTTLFENCPAYASKFLYNQLPVHIKRAQNLAAFKRNLKEHLMVNAFYSIEEFMNCDNWWWIAFFFNFIYIRILSILPYVRLCFFICIFYIYTDFIYIL